MLPRDSRKREDMEAGEEWGRPRSPLRLRLVCWQVHLGIGPLEIGERKPAVCYGLNAAARLGGLSPVAGWFPSVLTASNWPHYLRNWRPLDEGP